MEEVQARPRGPLLFAPTFPRPFHGAHSLRPHIAPPSCSERTTGGPEACSSHSLPEQWPHALGAPHFSLCPAPDQPGATGKDSASRQVVPSASLRIQNLPEAAQGTEACRVPEAVGTRRRPPPTPGGENGHILLRRVSHTAHRGLGRLPPSRPASPGVHRKPDPQDRDPHRRNEAHWRPLSPPQRHGQPPPLPTLLLPGGRVPSFFQGQGWGVWGWPVTSALQSPPCLF